MTKEFQCNCKHDYQDSVYGKWIRVFNSCGDNKGSKISAYRCTVCGKEIRP